MVRALGVQSGRLVVEQDERIARSVDGGETILHHDAPAGAPTCVAPVAGSPGAFVMVSVGGVVVRSVDDGATWAELDLVGAGACAPGATGALVVSDDAVWRVGVAEVTRVAPLEAPVRAVAEGAAAWGLDRDGALVRLDTTGATVVEAGPFTALAAGAGVLLRSGGMGIEASADDGESWSFTLDVPATVLAAGPTAWLATTADEGVWVTRDQGVTWLREDAGLEPLATGSGGPRPGEPHWFALADDGGTLWAAAWEGLYRMRAGETWWRQIETRSLPLVRSLQWVEGGLLTAPFGGGLALGTPGEAGWVDAAPDLGWPWLRQVLATEGGAGRWWMVGGQHMYATDDQGAAVFVVPTGANLDGDAVLVAEGWPGDPRVWLGGLDADQTALVSESADGGDTWTSTRLEGCATKPEGLVLVAGAPVASCYSAVWRRDEGGWSLWADVGGGILDLLPDGDGVLAATDGGLWRVGEGEPTLVDPRPVDALARLADGGALAATSDGLVRLADGVALGWPVDDVVVTLQVADDGRIAAGTYSGAWVSEDGGETWILATDWDRYDDADTAFYYAGAWTLADARGAKADSVHVGGEGSFLSWRVYGARLVLHAGGDGTAVVSVDGGGAAELALAGDVGVVWSADVPEGWHEVTLTVTAGTVKADGGERWREPVSPDPDKTEPEVTGCGCEAGGQAPGLLVGLAGALLGLRRRASRGAEATSS